MQPIHLTSDAAPFVPEFNQTLKSSPSKPQEKREVFGPFPHPTDPNFYIYKGVTNPIVANDNPFEIP